MEANLFILSSALYASFTLHQEKAHYFKEVSI